MPAFENLATNPNVCTITIYIVVKIITIVITITSGVIDKSEDQISDRRVTTSGARTRTPLLAEVRVRRIHEHKYKSLNTRTAKLLSLFIR